MDRQTDRMRERDIERERERQGDRERDRRDREMTYGNIYPTPQHSTIVVHGDDNDP